MFFTKQWWVSFCFDKLKRLIIRLRYLPSVVSHMLVANEKAEITLTFVASVMDGWLRPELSVLMDMCWSTDQVLLLSHDFFFFLTWKLFWIYLVCLYKGVLQTVVWLIGVLHGCLSLMEMSSFVHLAWGERSPQNTFICSGVICEVNFRTRLCLWIELKCQSTKCQSFLSSRGWRHESF